MKFFVDLSENEAQRLEATARRLGVRPEELAKAALSNLLDYPEEDDEP